MYTLYHFLDSSCHTDQFPIISSYGSKFNPNWHVFFAYLAQLLTRHCDCWHVSSWCHINILCCDEELWYLLPIMGDHPLWSMNVCDLWWENWTGRVEDRIHMMLFDIVEQGLTQGATMMMKGIIKLLVCGWVIFQGQKYLLYIIWAKVLKDIVEGQF